ncbi:MAG: D-alanyl-D-alanine carboxypeptidase/D-alanyl-D-alanine-endopeptidase [Acidobacteria bacterium]|nr:D-alanyl-D-alanine carboxypeptidase/D-alanyl-D-alanine-endopeptidase [Acidobacteriota bacterium]
MSAQKKPPKPAPKRERLDVAKFRARAEAILSAERINKGHWGVLIKDATTGETLYALNAGSFFTPASNTKMFTTAFALASLGPDYKFKTTLETWGTLDSRGRLRGDLILIGRGDPNLNNRKFPFAVEEEHEGPPEKTLLEMVDALGAKGVKQIEGDIVADDSWFSARRYPVGWDIDDMPFGYGAPVSAITINDSTLNIEVRPGAAEGQPASFNVEPWADFYQIENRVRTGTAKSDSRVRAEREPGSRRVILRGSIALDRESQLFQLAIEEPAEHAAALLKRLIEQRGIRVYGAARARHARDDTSSDGKPAPAIAVGEPHQVLAEHESVPLMQAIRYSNKVSQNLHSEIYLRAVAREKTGDGSTETGLRLAQEFFKSIGINEGDVATRDGSGLSRQNLVTPDSAVKLLTWVAQQPWAAAYIDSFPVSAQDGTLANRMKDTPAAGRISAKTGTLGHVNALGGYATTVHGTKLIFSMFGNAHTLRGSEATGALDAICVAMVEELGAPPPSKKRKK